MTPYREAVKRPGAFDVEVTVTIREVAEMVREYLLAQGWDPRKLPESARLDVRFGDDGGIVVTYKLDGEAP